MGKKFHFITYANHVFEKAKQRGEISQEVQIEVIKEDRHYKLGADGLKIFED